MHDKESHKRTLLADLACTVFEVTVTVAVAVTVKEAVAVAVTVAVVFTVTPYLGTRSW